MLLIQQFTPELTSTIVKVCLTLAHTMAHIQIPYTIKRNNIYYLNIRFGNKVQRYSLQTQDSYKAMGYIHDILRVIRSSINRNDMDNLHLKELVSSIISNIVTNATAILYTDSKEASQKLKSYEKSYSRAMYSLNHDTSFPTLRSYKLDSLYSDHHTPNQKSDYHLQSFLKWNEEYSQYDSDMIEADEKITIAYSQAKRIRQHIEQDDISLAIQALQVLITPANKKLAAAEEEPNLELFSICVENFIEERTNNKRIDSSGKVNEKWSDKTLGINTTNFKVLNIIFGDIPVNKITGKVLDEAFKSTILNLPKGNKKPYNNMSIQERVDQSFNDEVDDNDRISNKTANDYRKLLQGLFSYLRDEHILDESPTNDMRLRFNRKDRNTRGRFTDAQVGKILSFCNTKVAHQKWAPLIMSYSGMRNGEVMQLRTQDIQQDQETGIWFFLITKDAGSVKTNNSNRKIPISSELLNGGLLDYVKGVKERLFTGDGKTLTRFYEQISKYCNLPDRTHEGELLSLYSLRHAIITKLQEENINLAITQQIAGHRKQDTVTDQNYTHTFKLDKLRDAIEKVRY